MNNAMLAALSLVATILLVAAIYGLVSFWVNLHVKHPRLAIASGIIVGLAAAYGWAYVNVIMG